jgi:hypothetical protein
LPQNLYAWLKGRMPSSRNLMRLAEHLAASPAWLFFGERPPDGWAGAEIRQTFRPTRETPRAAGRPAPARHDRSNGVCQR